MPDTIGSLLAEIQARILDCREYPFTDEAIRGERLTLDEAERLDTECPRCISLVPLLELVRKPCPAILDGLCKEGILQADDSPWGRLGDKHKACAGTGYILRTVYWKAAPSGALEGALKKALMPLFTVIHPSEEGQLVRLLNRLDDLIDKDGDTRIPALEAVWIWLTR